MFIQIRLLLKFQIYGRLSCCLTLSIITRFENAVHKIITSSPNPRILKWSNISFTVQTPGVLCNALTNYQPNLWLHELCLEILAVHGTEFYLFQCKGISSTITYHTQISVVNVSNVAVGCRLASKTSQTTSWHNTNAAGAHKNDVINHTDLPLVN